MKYKNKKDLNNLVSAAIWFLVITCGLSYADTTVDPIPGVGLVASKMADGLTKIANGISANGGGNVGAVGTHVVHDGDVAQFHSTVSFTHNVVAADNRSTFMQKGMTDTQGQATTDNIKAYEAADRYAAAVEDLADAVTMAIVDEYLDKPQEKVEEEIIAEAKDLGYLTDAQLYAGDTDKFSLIAKAMADVGTQRDRSYTLPPTGKGVPLDGSQLSNNYGASCNPGTRTPSQALFCGVVFQTKPAFSKLPPIPKENCKQRSTDSCAGQWSNRMVAEIDVVKKTHQAIHKAFRNTHFAGSGNPGAFNDIPSFFISKAYASNNTTASVVMDRKNDVVAAVSDFCQAAQTAHKVPSCNPATQTGENGFFIRSAFASGSGDASELQAQNMSQDGVDGHTHDIPGRDSADVLPAAERQHRIDRSQWLSSDNDD